MNVIGKFQVNALSIEKEKDSPFYKFKIVGDKSNFYLNDFPNIIVNETAFEIDELSYGLNMEKLHHRIVDSYTVLVTRVIKYSTKDDKFYLEFNGQRLDSDNTSFVAEPTISNIFSYGTTLALIINGDIDAFYTNDELKPSKPEAEDFLAKINTITHLGTTYKRLHNQVAIIRTRIDLPDESPIFPKSGLVLYYSSVEVPVSRDLDIVKNMTRHMF